MKTVKAILIVAIFLMIGCASFQGSVLPKVSSFPVVSEKPSAGVTLSFRQYLNDQPINILVKTMEGNLEQKVLERFEKSGLYSSVTSLNPSSDITVEIDVIDDGRGSMVMAVITGLSLYIIPSSTTDTFKVSAKVINNRTGAINMIELEDFVTQWQQILLLPIMPFCLNPVVTNRVLNNLFDTLAIRVHEAAVKNISDPISNKAKSEYLLKRLNSLKDAYDAGLISQKEYEKKKLELMKGF